MKFIVILLSLLMVSCTFSHNDELLHSTYSHYESSMDKDNLPQLSLSFFSENLLAGLNLYDPEVSNQLLFKSYMPEQLESFETIKNSIGCLTINGLDDKGTPISFNIKFIYENEVWVIDDIGILFIDSPSEFSQLAKCPSDYQN